MPGAERSAAWHPPFSGIFSHSRHRFPPDIFFTIVYVSPLEHIYVSLFLRPLANPSDMPYDKENMFFHLRRFS